MEFLSEKQSRNYFQTLLILCLVILLLPACFTLFHLQESNHLILQREQTLVSSLLEHGISEELLASSLNDTGVSPEGLRLMEKVNHTEDTLPWIFPGYSLADTAFFFLILFLLLLIPCLILISVSIFFLQKRENLYQQALSIVTRFSEGDFSPRLSDSQAGTLYQLFSKTDQLATALKSKSETEYKSREFLKNMLSDISHQLKTPLAALSMYQEIIQAEPENQKTVLHFSQKSTQSLLRMESLIQTLLKMSRMDAGSVTFEMRPCSVLELIHSALSELQTRALQEGKEILLPNQDNTIFCDFRWTREALGNLIKNALDHTDTGGKIKISCDLSPLMLRLSVSDNGEGIAPEDIHHIFKRFYRSKSSPDAQGVGLGLPLAKAIMEGQGGSLCVQSTLGKGSIFTLSFLTKS